MMAALNPRDEDTVIPCLTKNVGIQPVTVYEPNRLMMVRSKATNVRRMTGRENSTVNGTQSAFSFSTLAMCGAAELTSWLERPDSLAIRSKTASASLCRPRDSSHLGDSGIPRRSHHVISAPTPPRMNIARQDQIGMTNQPMREDNETPSPAKIPSTPRYRPRRLRGMNSVIMP